MRGLSVVLVLISLACGVTDPEDPLPALCAGSPSEPISLDYSVVDASLMDTIPDVPTLRAWDAATDLSPDIDNPPLCEPYGHRSLCDTNLLGRCSTGVTLCLGSSWTDCIQQSFPRAESCDSEDNDCDGRYDELLQRPCYSANANTLKVGPCVGGVRSCHEGEFGACIGEVVPQDEVCDLVDNDCDGSIDEGVTNACGICGPDLPELCNFEDEDCDGHVDEGAGNCQCDNPLYVPQPELCNGEDEDCDGRIDEGPAGGPLTRFCATGVDGVVQSFERAEDGPQFAGGECRAGLSFCSMRAGEHGFFECLHEIRPAFERCNEVDDDCDGEVDEAFEQGRAAVLFVLDVSGSMSLEELTEAFVTAQQSVEALHLDGLESVCYSLAMVGSDIVRDPMLIYPADDCVAGVQDPPQNPRRDLITAITRLRDLLERNQIPRGGARENTLDALGAWFADDLVDSDQDGRLDEHTWFSNDPMNDEKSIDLNGAPHRIAVILGDEEAQGVDWNAQGVADLMLQVGGVAYILGPADARVRGSYAPILEAGGVYLVMRDPIQQEEGAVANGIRQAVDELACLAGDG